MHLNIAVVDDKRLDSEKLQRGIHKWFTDYSNTPRTITCFPDGEALLKVYEPEKFQLVFMDIIMNSMNGIQTAEHLRAYDSRALLIFTTASREFAFDAFPLHPFDYLVKPYEPDRLGQVLREAVKTLTTPEPILRLKVSRTTYAIPFRDVSAALSRDHFVEIVMFDGKCMLGSMAFREVEAILMEDSRFLLCNRGLIINMDNVASISRDKDSFIMNDGSHYPIRVHGRPKLLAAFTQYQINKMREKARQ